MPHRHHRHTARLLADPQRQQSCAPPHRGPADHSAAAGASGTCHPSKQSHCVAGQHSHAATSGTCVSDAHGAGPGKCRPADGSGYRHSCPNGGYLHDGLDCHSPSVDNYPQGEHEHTSKVVFPKVQGCHDLDSQHNTGDLSRIGDIAGEGAGIGCDRLYDKLIREEQRQHEKDKKDDHDEHADDKREKDDNDGEQPTPTTASPSVPGDTDGDGSVSDDEVAEAERKFLNGEIDGNELNKIQNRRDCDKGYSWAENCE